MISSSGFTLMWNAPPPEDHNGIIRHYAIHIIEVNTGMEYPSTSGVTQKAIDSLHPYYNYTCAVSAVTSQTGPFSIELNVRTSEDGRSTKTVSMIVLIPPMPPSNELYISELLACSLLFSSVPNGQPTNVDATADSSTSVTIFWDPPSPENQNGVIIAYAINLTTVGSGDVSQYSSSTDNITIPSLNPFTSYTFTVAAQTSAGTGPFTTISTTVMTLEDGNFQLCIPWPCCHPLLISAWDLDVPDFINYK